MSRVALAASAAVAVACGGAQVRLEPEKAESIALALANGTTSFCANGNPARFRAVVTYQDGKQVTAGPGGKLPPTDLEWRSEIGSIDTAGRLVLPQNPFVWMDQLITVQARVPGRPEVAGEVAVSPRFDCGGVADFSGRDGAAGGVGGNGGRGARGPRLRVALGYVETDRNGRLVMARVTSGGGGAPRYFLVGARGTARPFVISAAGGDGGPGGRGRAGQPGAPGRDGTDGADGGTCEDGEDGGDGTDGQNGGDGGPGGNGGDGADGGVIEILYPEEHPEIVETIRFDVAGGRAGPAGRGGPGGRGGDGGDGGDGGLAGSTFDADGEHCSTSRGQDGADGRDGLDGQPGPDGHPGRPGRDGQVAAATAKVRELFAEELERGVPVVLEEAAGAGD